MRKANRKPPKNYSWKKIEDTILGEYKHHNEEDLRKGQIKIEGHETSFVELAKIHTKSPQLMYQQIPDTRSWVICVPSMLTTALSAFLYTFDVLYTFEQLRLLWKNGKNHADTHPFFDITTRYCTLTILSYASTEWDRYWLFPKGLNDMKWLVGLLRNSNIDPLLKIVGGIMGYKNPTIYSCNFYLVGRTEQWPQMHIDGNDGEDDYYAQLIIPIRLLDDSPPELLLMAESDADKIYLYKYVLQQAVLLPQSQYHQTASVQGQWDSPGDLRICLFMAIGDRDICFQKCRNQTLKQIHPGFPYPQSTIPIEELCEKKTDLNWRHWTSNWTSAYELSKEHFNPTPKNIT